MGRTGHPLPATCTAWLPHDRSKALGADLVLGTAGITRRALGTDDPGRRSQDRWRALIEAVVDIIETEGLLANVRRRSQQIRETCVVGPVESVQGAGLLAGLRTRRPAKDVQRELLERDILAGTSGDPHVVRILAPYVLEESHVAQLRDALASLPA
jgi:hypothetical protein